MSDRDVPDGAPGATRSQALVSGERTASGRGSRPRPRLVEAERDGAALDAVTVAARRDASSVRSVSSGVGATVGPAGAGSADSASRLQPDDDALPPSERPFGDFTLLRRLAFGGMGEVFLARPSTRTGTDDLVVVKRILAHVRRDDKHRQMFLDEARLQGMLRSPNIVQVQGVGEHGGYLYLAMEYVYGASWRAVVDRCRERKTHMPLAFVVSMMEQVCAALSYAHNLVDDQGHPLRVVHRDINPHNILVSFGGDVKLIDFGIAKSELREQQTETGTIKGKFAYMSPEQSAAEPLDARSDLFALGICLYELLTLHNPFKKGNIVLSLEAIQRLTPKSVAEVRPGAAILAPVVERMLRKNPDDRFADCREVAEALAQLRLDGLVPEARRSFPEWLAELFSDVMLDHERVLGAINDEDRRAQAEVTSAGSRARAPLASAEGTTEGGLLLGSDDVEVLSEFDDDIAAHSPALDTAPVPQPRLSTTQEGGRLADEQPTIDPHATSTHTALTPSVERAPVVDDDVEPLATTPFDQAQATGPTGALRLADVHPPPRRRWAALVGLVGLMVLLVGGTAVAVIAFGGPISTPTPISTPISTPPTTTVPTTVPATVPDPTPVPLPPPPAAEPPTETPTAGEQPPADGAGLSTSADPKPKVVRSEGKPNTPEPSPEPTPDPTPDRTPDPTPDPTPDSRLTSKPEAKTAGRVAVSAEGFLVRGSRSLRVGETSVLVVDDADAPFALRLKLRPRGAQAELELSSEPWAIVRVGNVGKGRTPVTGIMLDPRRKTMISLQNPAGAKMDVAVTYTPVRGP